MISRFCKLTSRFFLIDEKLFEDMLMIFRPIIISHCCCTEFSDSLCGSNSIVPTLPSSSGKQLFHPTSLEDRRNDKHKNQEDEFLLRLSLLSHTNYSTHCYKISNCVQKFYLQKIQNCKIEFLSSKRTFLNAKFMCII